MCFPQRQKPFILHTYYYYTQVHSGDLFWNLDVFLKKLTVVFSLWSKQYITGLNGTFFQIFFSPTVWETKNLDAKLRTNDWPGGQKCSSTRSPRTGFSRCFFYSTRKNVLYVLCLRFQCQPSLYLKRKKLKKIYCMCNIKMSVIS